MTRETDRRDSAAQNPEPWERAERIPADKTAGEISLGELTAELGELSAETAGQAENRRGFLARVLAVFQNQKTLIPLLGIVAVWIVLPLLKKPDALPVKLLSWLTFAKGGLGRNAVGAIGGALGRGVAAAGLISLFNGGFGAAAKGVASLWKDGGEKRSLVPLLIGAAVGAGLYLFFAGIKTASLQTTMAGISGALLSLEALGKQGGGLSRLARALTAKAENGVRTARRCLSDSLLIGLSLGSVLAAAVAAAF